MDCTTQIVDKINGQLIDKPKKKFDDLETAIKHAKSANLLRDRTFKVVAYKCKTCHKFHVGKNGAKITNKERERWKPKSFQFKIVGKIDLK
jgi:hypothetical protein